MEGLDLLVEVRSPRCGQPLPTVFVGTLGGELRQHVCDFVQCETHLSCCADHGEATKHVAGVTALVPVIAVGVDEASFFVETATLSPSTPHARRPRQSTTSHSSLDLHITRTLTLGGMTSTFTAAEVEYPSGQRLARLATVRSDGSPQNNPVGFVVEENSIVIGGYDLQSTQKFRNLRISSTVSVVADDIASLDPWIERGVEIRGHRSAEVDVDPPVEWMSRDLIRIEPTRIVSWGLDDRTATDPGARS